MAARDMQTSIIDFCEQGLTTAECEIAVERLSGNIVKEEHWKGEACAYRAVLAALVNQGAPTVQQVEARLTALGVYEEFLRSAEYINGDGFRPWLKACLNPPKAADCT